MREDPYAEFGRLELEEDFGFGTDPSEAHMMGEDISYAFDGDGLFLAGAPEPNKNTEQESALQTGIVN